MPSSVFGCVTFDSMIAWFLAGAPSFLSTPIPERAKNSKEGPRWHFAS
jgi:hypothetical protein